MKNHILDRLLKRKVLLAVLDKCGDISFLPSELHSPVALVSESIKKIIIIKNVMLRVDTRLTIQMHKQSKQKLAFNKFK